MNCKDKHQTLRMSATNAFCPIGEAIGQKNRIESKIPVLSCEGACIRGEIARRAASLVARSEAYGRGCHGELLTVPDSAIARWIKTSPKVVLIDGCFLRCHGRIMENIIDADKLIQFDALSHYNRYTDIFDYEDVPEKERENVAQAVADWVLASLKDMPAEGIPSAGRCSGGCG